MCLQLGYPDPQAERALLEGEDRRELLPQLPICLETLGVIGVTSGSP